MAAVEENISVSTKSPMREVVAAYPGAQRSLFRKYHIGGCSSCAFSPDESLEQLCARNGGLNPGEVLSQIQQSHEEDARLFIEPVELKDLIKSEPSVRLVDVRSREEFEAVHIANSQLLSQDVMRQIMGDGSNTRPLVLIDHQGKQSLDAAAYFLGHGLQNVRCLKGGIDAWAQQIDNDMPRYQVN
jgi:rhodanese-related sulfurtransferase